MSPNPAPKCQKQYCYVDKILRIINTSILKEKEMSMERNSEELYSEPISFFWGSMLKWEIRTNSESILPMEIR